jgi:serine phosphatase RsbU (regulator of sigma subunit)
MEYLADGLMKIPRDFEWLFPASAASTAAAVFGVLAWDPVGAVPQAVSLMLAAAAVVVPLLLFRRQARVAAALRAAAGAAQQGLLRPVPDGLPGLRAEVRYVAAQPGALVGGDIYDVACTPYGVRLLVGDVMGKGLPAVDTAMDALGSFRELVRCEPRLAAVAQRMDASLAGRQGRDDFVTALLLAVNDSRDRAELVSCGHPPPLLIRARRATFVDALPPAPPLGLFDLCPDWCRESTLPLSAGDRLLLYTDGVTEARDSDGYFYPLAERAAQLYHEDASEFLDILTADLIQHSSGRLSDDAALLAIDFGDIRSQGHSSEEKSAHRI